MVVAKKIDQVNLPHVGVFYAGRSGRYTRALSEEFQPDHTLFLDAADMGARPSNDRGHRPWSHPGKPLSTHALPLTVVMDYVEREIRTRVTLLGIQRTAPIRERVVRDERPGIPEPWPADCRYSPGRWKLYRHREIRHSPGPIAVVKRSGGEDLTNSRLPCIVCSS